jgi:hypothetical protein
MCGRRREDGGMVVVMMVVGRKADVATIARCFRIWACRATGLRGWLIFDLLSLISQASVAQLARALLEVPVVLGSIHENGKFYFSLNMVRTLQISLVFYLIVSSIVYMYSNHRIVGGIHSYSMWN